MRVTFWTGIPPLHVPILVEGYGPATLEHFTEDGEVDIYIGGGRTLRISGDTVWHEARRPK